MADLEGQQNESAEDWSSVSQSEDESDRDADAGSKVYTFIDDNRQNACLQGFNELYETKQLLDLKLCVDNKIFECHKSLLASSSEYFRTMFTTNLMERDESEVTINGVDAQSMELIIKYLYTGKVDLETETVQNLLSAANLFQLGDLRTGCAAFMAEKLDNENCLGIHFFAQAHECTFLQEEAKDMIMENFLDVSETTEFLELAPEHLMQILKCDEIRAVEEDIFESARMWLEHNPDDRSAYIYDVFSLIRFMLIGEYFLYDRVKNNRYLQSEQRIQDLLDEVVKFKMLTNRLVECDLMLEPRLGYDYTRMIVYTSYMDDEKRQMLQMYVGKSETPAARKLGLCSIPVENPALLVTGDKDLYLAGGDDGSHGLFKWSPEENAFEDCAAMPVNRKHFCLVQVDKNIYAVGGRCEDSNLSRVDCYDEAEDEWKPVAPMPKALRCFCAVAFRGKLYVFGGETEKTSKKVTRGRAELNKQTLCYDPHENKWTVLAEMSQARALAGCTVYNNKIYVVGGFGQITESWIKNKSPEHCLASVEIYDPEENSWTKGPDLPVPLCGMGVVKFRGTIYVLGGEDDDDETNWVYSLNSAADGWQQEEDMVTGITETTVYSSYAVATIPD